jgi:5-methylcytosine-specific restriction enzyme A
MMTSATEKTLEGELRRCVEECRAAGYNPSYFVQMIDDRGALGACRKLINDNAPSEGFTKLWELGRVDLTVEAVALRSPYSGLFTQAERLKARHRLEEYGYRT